MTQLVVYYNRWSSLFVALVSTSSLVLASCGEQSTPVLQAVSSKQEDRAEAEILNARASNAIRSSSADESDAGSSQAAKRLEVFSSRLEPLTLQKGGAAKIVLPLSTDLSLRAKLRSVAFLSDSTGLKESSVQGKILNVVVSEDAVEGRHEGKVVVRFENGSEFSQPISITILP